MRIGLPGIGMGHGGGGPAPAWTPANQVGVQTWYDATDASSITIATGISQWNDKSGNARHLTNATGAQQPANTASVLNGLAVARFDGGDDRLVNTAYKPTGSLGIGFVVIPRRATPQGFETILSWETSGGGSTSLGVYANAAYGSTTRTLGFGNAPSTLSSWTNGTSYGAQTAGGAGPTLVRDAAIIVVVTVNISSTDNNLGVGSFPGGVATLFGNNDIADIAMWTTPGDTKRQLYEGFAAHRFALTANLPGGHPYKTVAP